MSVNDLLFPVAIPYDGPDVTMVIPRPVDFAALNVSSRPVLRPTFPNPGYLWQHAPIGGLGQAGGASTGRSTSL